MKKKINYTYFAVDVPERILNWDENKLFGLECSSITELRSKLKAHGYLKTEYHVCVCASCIDGDTTYYGCGFDKETAYIDLMNQL